MSTAQERRRERMLAREQIANRRKHWVRIVTACNSRCSFCLDTDTPRNLYLPDEDVHAELLRGREELGADKVIISGGEASLHPRFFDFIRYARSIGYDRVQTVTNGYFLGKKAFYDEAIEAGLGEITFSLHGHTEELHDEITGTPGGFKRIVKGIARAARDPRVIANVDVVICKPNAGVLDKIVELSIKLGITEFDLLHVIPQAAAFENREQLFYDPADHIEVLHKVFKLNRHPGFVIWTNRFPVPFLEGLEEVIQDPHKMLDEVNGRRFMVRRYLDQGRALDCRQPERCVHCFIEPFCTTMDRTIQRQHDAGYEVWWVGDAAPDAATPLPFGCSAVGVDRPELGDLAELTLPAGAALHARVDDAPPLPSAAQPTTLWTRTAAQIGAWLGDLPEGYDLVVELNRDTATALHGARELLATRLDRVRVHQPSHEHMADAVAGDLRNPAAFFESLALPALRVSGLAACLAPGTTLAAPPRVLRDSLFEAGRLSIRELARDHVADGYRSQSLRCRDCRVADRCDGIHVNMVRDQGLRLAQPLVDGAWADEADRQLRALHPEPPPSLERGAPPLPPADSLPGYDRPTAEVVDPLAVVFRDKQRDRAKRRAALNVLRDGDA